VLAALPCSFLRIAICGSWFSCNRRLSPSLRHSASPLSSAPATPVNPWSARGHANPPASAGAKSTRQKPVLVLSPSPREQIVQVRTWANPTHRPRSPSLIVPPPPGLMDSLYSTLRRRGVASLSSSAVPLPPRDEERPHPVPPGPARSGRSAGDGRRPSGRGRRGVGRRRHRRRLVLGRRELWGR
jgi:hypothetical protein